MQAKKNKKKVVPLSMDPNIVKKLDSMAKENSRSRSGQVEFIINQFLKIEEKKDL